MSQPKPRPPVAEELDLLSLEDAADYLGVSIRTIHELRETGRLAYRRLGRRVWISRVDLRALVEETT